MKTARRSHVKIIGVALALLALLVGPSATALAQLLPFQWAAEIAIVWPQDGQGHPASLGKSRAVNVSVWPRNQVYCTNRAPYGPPFLNLYVAKNNDPGDLLVPKNYNPYVDGPLQPQFTVRTVGGTTFPSAEYNGVAADLAADPTARYSLIADFPGGSNVWVHGADPRTDYPNPVVPTGFVTDVRLMGNIDLRIQIVWPHDAQGRYAPPDRATFVNVAVDIFQHGTLLSVPPDFLARTDYFGPYLDVAEDNQPLRPPDFSRSVINQPGGHAEQTSYTVNGQAFPRWVFNDIPVQPAHQYHFLALVGSTKAGPQEHPTIWTHAADARTMLPTPQPPPPCIP